jgi:hypothetical protein
MDISGRNLRVLAKTQQELLMPQQEVENSGRHLRRARAGPQGGGVDAGLVQEAPKRSFVAREPAKGF